MRRRRPMREEFLNEINWLPILLKTNKTTPKYWDVNENLCDRDEPTTRTSEIILNILLFLPEILKGKTTIISVCFVLLDGSSRKRLNSNLKLRVKLNKC